MRPNRIELVYGSGSSFSSAVSQFNSNINMYLSSHDVKYVGSSQVVTATEFGTHMYHICQEIELYQRTYD
jgi:hypothetical protein